MRYDIDVIRTYQVFYVVLRALRLWTLLLNFIFTYAQLTIKISSTFPGTVDLYVFVKQV